MPLISRRWKVRDWLLLDGVGATLTALSTGLFLATGSIPTGLPSLILWSMAVVASAFACFDFWAALCRSENRWPLSTIGVFNVCYCIVAIGLCLTYGSTLTIQGLIYFSVECCVVIPLGLVEIFVANRKT